MTSATRAAAGRVPIRDEAINVFMNQPGDGDSPRLELAYNFGVDSYEIGTDACVPMPNWTYTGWRRPADAP
jgi:hypothetical protein